MNCISNSVCLLFNSLDQKESKKKAKPKEEVKEHKKSDSFKVKNDQDNVNPDRDQIQDESKENILKQFNSFNLPKGDIDSLNSERNEKKKFIKNNAFIGCKFNETSAQNRWNGLIDFRIEDWSSIQINSLRFFWVYKLIILNKHSEYFHDKSLDENWKEETKDDDKVTINLTNKFSDLSILQSNERGRKGSNDIGNNELNTYDSDEFINDILLKHTHFGVEFEELFLGKQKWVSEKNQERGSFDITKLNIEEPLDGNLFCFIIYIESKVEEKQNKTSIINIDKIDIK